MTILGKNATDNPALLLTKGSSTVLNSLLSVDGGVSGTFTANGATEVIVADKNIGPDSVLLFGLKTASGTVAGVFQSSVVAGTSFGVKSVALNASTYNYLIINPR